MTERKEKSYTWFGCIKIGEGKIIYMKNKKRIPILLISLIIVFCICITYFSYEPTEKVLENRTQLVMTQTESEFILDEDNFEREMEQTVSPFLKQYEVESELTAKDGKNLYYRTYWKPESKGTIVILHGFTEFSKKYEEMTYYYLKNGYSVCIMEHRGHGNSDREIDNPCKVHINSMDQYVEDMKEFMDQVVVPGSKKQPLYLFAHSMGGGIGTLFVEAYPDYFKKVILNAPMLGFKTGKYTTNLAKTVGNLACLFGQGKAYVFGHGDFDGTENFEGSVMTSRTRYEHCIHLRQENEQYQTSGATFQWLKAAFNGTKKALKDENLGKITCPVLLFQAAEDVYVTEYGEYYFVNHVKQTEFVYVPDSKHETFNSTNQIIIPYYEKVFSFLEE